MAKMSMKEKLAAARAGGPAKPAEEEPSVPAEEAAAEAPEPPAAAAEPPPSARAAAPRPQPTGKKLTLKEKLAAAKAGGPAVAGAPAAPSEAEPAVSEPEPEPEPEPAVEAAPAPRPAPTGRKLTLAEKLAAAKAGGAAPAAGAPTAKPTAAKAGAAPAAKGAAAPKRELPPLEKATDPRDLAEHLRRAGAAKAKAVEDAKPKPEPSKAATAKKVPDAKVVPPRPPREQAAEAGESRREFLSVSAAVAVVVAGWTAFTAAMFTLTMGTLRFMFPNVLAEPPSTIKVGLPSNFEPGMVNETWKAEWGFWIVRSSVYNGQDSLYALSTICTHLGCPPNWLGGEQKFKCPCHGSGFYISGVNFEGPAPRPLERFKVSVGDDGQIVVDKSQKYQEELGQWADPDSFIPMA